MTRRRQVLYTGGIATLAFLAAGLVAWARGDGIGVLGELTRDPATVAALPWWTGSMSLVTGMLWGAATAIAGLAAAAGGDAPRHALLGLSVLCGLLGLDDMLLLHEAALPGIGVPELLVMAAYGVVGAMVAGLFLMRWRTWVGGAFFVGAALLAFSVGWDVASPVTLYVVEDGAKLLAVSAWVFCGIWAFRDALDQPGASTRHSPRGLTAS